MSGAVPSARRIATGVAVLALCLGALGGGSLSAQPAAPAAGDVRMEVLSFTGALGPGDAASVRLRIHNEARREVEGLRVLVTVHRKVFHRSDFHQAVDEGRLGNLWSSFGDDVEVVPGRRTHTLELRQSAAELGFTRPNELYGVYPVRIQLQHLGDVVDEVITALVLAPAEVDQPLRAALIVPLDSEPTLGPDGGVATEPLLREYAPGGRVAMLAEAVEVAGEAGVTIATSGRFLEQASTLAGDPESPLATRAASLLERIRALGRMPGVEQIALPYGPADLVALVRGGMRSEVTRLILEGRDRTEDLTGVRPERGVLLPPEGLDAQTLADAVHAGTRVVVLDESWLDIPDVRELPSSPSPVRQVSSGTGTSATALVPDPWLAPLLRDVPEDLEPALVAQRILAETAVLYFERPFAERPRGVLLSAPLLWDPPPELASVLVQGLIGSPWLRPVTLSALGSEVPEERGTVRVSYPARARQDELSAEYVAALRGARRSLGSLAGVLADGTDTPVRFDRLLLTASSVHYRDRPDDGRALIRQVASTVGQLYEAVEVVPGPTVLLSSLEGQIPVTVANTADVPMRIRVRLATNRYEFEGGPVREVTLDPASNRTITYRARALAAGGTFQVGVLVEDVDGVITLADGTIVVRSTAVSLTALVITIGAALFLVGWWIRLASRRRRSADLPREPASA